MNIEHLCWTVPALDYFLDCALSPDVLGVSDIDLVTNLHFPEFVRLLPLRILYLSLLPLLQLFGHGIILLICTSQNLLNGEIDYSALGIFPMSDFLTTYRSVLFS